MTTTVDTEIQTELTINDLRNIALIIELCNTKGIFPTKDLVAIGTIYNKLTTIINLIDKEKVAGADVI